MSSPTHREGDPREPTATAPHLDEAVDVGLSNPEAYITPQKVCCVCGKNLKGRERYKDALGRYWCLKCGDADHAQKHQNDQAECPECKQSFTLAILVDYEGKKLCEQCRHKLELAHKRELARIHAAEEEAKAQALRQKRIIIGISIVAALLVIYFTLRTLGWT